ncbi:MAG: hypothetical protein Q8Q60_01225 [Candidatus Chromulinivorax sp.]|nr:hypothetical protein [Candidatus Chromulinivorax sp.]
MNHTTSHARRHVRQSFLVRRSLDVGGMRSLGGFNVGAKLEMIKKYMFLTILIIISAGCTNKKVAQELSDELEQPIEEMLSQEDIEAITLGQERVEDSSVFAHQDLRPDKDESVKIQGFWTDMAFDVGVMLAMQQGASMANAHITAQGALLSSKISKNSTTIQNSMQAFQSKAQTNQQQKLKAMMTAFSDAQKDVMAKTQQAAAISNLELDYLYKNISINQPQQNYIFNQIQFDQLYSLGTMLTPQGVLWKNPFSVGDWEYEKSSNSFWQYESLPLINQTTDDDGNVTSSSLQAENNAIYAEYFTKATSYIIAGSITLNSIKPPFFTGIIFNKARWISGDFEAIRKCRMIGIYGASSDDIGIYFAQQYTMDEAQMEANPNDDPIQTPLQQIINKKITKTINLPSDAFANLQNNPVTFNYEITNSPTTVTLKLWTGNNQPITTTINNLDPEIYMYHGIGFICPGATAQFTVTQPQDFIFTPQAISSYKE